MAKISIDEQLAKAEDKVKRLKQKKTLVEAKKAIAERDNLLKQVEDLKHSLSNNIGSEKTTSRDLKIANDSINWTRGAIKNLVNELDKMSVTINQGKDNQWPGVNAVIVKQRLQQILNGKQPTQKK